MAYDPSHENAFTRIAQTSRIFDLPLRPIAGDKEYELKLNFSPWSFRNISNQIALVRGKDAFFSLMGHFQTRAKEGPKTSPVLFDPLGALPNDYILISLGLDTKETLPSAEFFINNTQFRLRFPLTFCKGSFSPRSQVIAPTNLDANLKDLLSTLQEGQHRIELETTIDAPETAIAEFKQKLSAPAFMADIHDDDLSVSEICMTSRTGFFLLYPVPGHDAYILLHGCYDVSNYTTPCIEVYTRRNHRIEIEFEAKALIGNDPSLDKEATQREAINLAFSEIIAASKPLGFKPFELSKMEDAARSVQNFYEGRIPIIAESNSPLRGHFNEKGIPPYLAYALTQGVKAPDIIRQITQDGINSPIARLANGLPDPKSLLGDNWPIPCDLKIA